MSDPRCPKCDKFYRALPNLAGKHQWCAACGRIVWALVQPLTNEQRAALEVEWAKEAARQAILDNEAERRRAATPPVDSTPDPVHAVPVSEISSSAPAISDHSLAAGATASQAGVTWPAKPVDYTIDLGAKLRSALEKPSDDQPLSASAPVPNSTPSDSPPESDLHQILSATDSRLREAEEAMARLSERWGSRPAHAPEESVSSHDPAQQTEDTLRSARARVESAGEHLSQLSEALETVQSSAETKAREVEAMLVRLRLERAQQMARRHIEPADAPNDEAPSGQPVPESASGPESGAPAPVFSIAPAVLDESSQQPDTAVEPLEALAAPVISDLVAAPVALPENAEELPEEIASAEVLPATGDPTPEVSGNGRQGPASDACAQEPAAEPPLETVEVAETEPPRETICDAPAVPFEDSEAAVHAEVVFDIDSIAGQSEPDAIQVESPVHDRAFTNRPPYIVRDEADAQIEEESAPRDALVDSLLRFLKPR